MRLRRVVLAGTAALLAAVLVRAAIPAGDPEDLLEPCSPAGVAPLARCGTLEVPEDRGSDGGRTIGLRIVVLRATGDHVEPDPLFVLLGGPGSAAAGAAAGIGAEFASVRVARDIVLVDQRGVGGSNAMECELYGGDADLQAYLGEWYPPAAIRACRENVLSFADPRHYTTTSFVHDLEDVRGALGYETINLYGISYGTRAALEYTRRYLHAVRSAVLNGVVSPDVAVPLDMAAGAQRALDGVIADCAADAACAAAFPRLATDATALFERLAEEPARVRIAHPDTGEPVRIELSRDLAAESLRYLLYGSGSAGLVPLVLTQAAAGDLAPLAEHALFWRRNLVGEGAGLYLSVTCAEDLPRVDPDEGARLARGTFLGDYRVRAQLAACAEWPRGEVPDDFHTPVRADVPVLLVSGQWDPATPPANAERAARYLPNAHHIVVPHGGHGYEGLVGAECVSDLVAEFFARGGADELDTSCVTRVSRPPFPTEPLAMGPLELPVEVLRRLGGTYRGDPEPFEVRLEVAGPGLRLHLPDGQEVLAVPVAPARFRLLGPMGYYLAFELADDGRHLATLEHLGVPVIAVRRTPSR